MRFILPAYSRLSSFGLQLQPRPRLVALHGGLLRRFHTPTGKFVPEVLNVLAKGFHGPDEEDPSLEDCHLSLMPGSVAKIGDDEYHVKRKLRGRLFSRVWLATHINERYDIDLAYNFIRTYYSKRWSSRDTIGVLNAGTPSTTITASFHWRRSTPYFLRD